MTTAIIARPTTDGFQGRLIHDDQHPEARVQLLRALYHDSFDRDLDALSAHLLGGDQDSLLLDQDTAHDASADQLLLLEPAGVAVFEADRIGDQRTWTWIRRDSWNCATPRTTR